MEIQRIICGGVFKDISHSSYRKRLFFHIYQFPQKYISFFLNMKRQPAYHVNYIVYSTLLSVADTLHNSGNVEWILSLFHYIVAFQV